MRCLKSIIFGLLLILLSVCPALADNSFRALNPPELAAPADGEVNAGSNVTFSWISVSGAINYTIQLSKFDDFRLITANQTGIADTSVTIGIDSLTSYYWRVRANDGSAISDWSTIWSFADAKGFTFSVRVMPIVYGDDSLFTPVTDTITDSLNWTEHPDYGFYFYIKNLTGRDFDFTMLALDEMCSDSSFSGGVCGETSCGPPNMPYTEPIASGYTARWTVHFQKKDGSPWSIGSYFINASMCSSADGSNLMVHPIYLSIDSIANGVAKDNYENPRASVLFLGCGPNPCGEKAMIKYQLPKAGNVSLNIYDISGRLVKILEKGTANAGTYQKEWNLTDDSGHKVANGIYLYKLTVGNSTTTNKLTVVR